MTSLSVFLVPHELSSVVVSEVFKTSTVFLVLKKILRVCRMHINSGDMMDDGNHLNNSLRTLLINTK